MNMVGVPIPRPHLRHPKFVTFALNPAQLFLNCRIDQNPFDLGLFGGRADERNVGSAPGLWIDALPIGGDQVARYNTVAFLWAQHTVGHRHEPDVDIKTNLVAFVPEWQGTTARLS